MKKDKKFLLELDKNLEGISSKKRKEIISKYENIIKEELEKKRKITSILKDFGKPADVALKEKELLKNNSSFKDKLVSFYYKISKPIEIKKKDKVKKEKVKKEKVKKEKVVKAKKEKNTKTSNKFLELKDKLVKFFKNLGKKISNLFSKLKLSIKKIKFKRKVKKVKDKVADTVNDVKEEIVDKVEEIKEEVIENSPIIIEMRESRSKRVVKNIVGTLILTVLLLLWLVVCSLLMSTVVAYLDGIKFYGTTIAFGGLALLIFWLIILVNRILFNKKVNWIVNLIMICVPVLITACGVALTIKYFSDIQFVEDVSEKYSMVTKTETHKLPSDTSKNMYISFNANYDTKYVIEYDHRLKDKVKIEVKYYEVYYDYYTKKSSNNIYVSLKLDDRDRLSVYLDDLKEGKVYDNDELSRYQVKIYVNKNDYRRLVILD